MKVNALRNALEIPAYLIQPSRYEDPAGSLLLLDEDPFATCDDFDDDVDRHEMDELIVALQKENRCSVDEFIIEDDIPVCQESNYEEWEDDFFAQLGPLAKKSTEDLDEELDDEDNDIELPMNTSTSVVKITSYLDAINGECTGIPRA